MGIAVEVKVHNSDSIMEGPNFYLNTDGKATNIVMQLPPGAYIGKSESGNPNEYLSFTLTPTLIEELQECLSILLNNIKRLEHSNG